MNGKEFKEIRIKNGITQKELADYLEISPRTLISYEKSENISPAKERLLMAAVNEMLTTKKSGTAGHSEPLTTENCKNCELLEKENELLRQNIADLRAHIETLTAGTSRKQA